MEGGGGKGGEGASEGDVCESAATLKGPVADAGDLVGDGDGLEAETIAECGFGN